VDAIGIAAGTCTALPCARMARRRLGRQQFPPDQSPAGLSNVIAVAAGGNHTLALKPTAPSSPGAKHRCERKPRWPVGGPWGLTNVVAIGAGQYHSLAVRADGNVVAWGDNSQGQTSVLPGLTNVVAAAGGGAHSVALAADGKVAVWGANWSGQCDLPPALPPISGIAAGGYHTAILLATASGAATAQSGRINSRFSALIQTLNCKHYALEFNDSLAASNWTALATNAGNGGLRVLTDPAATGSSRF